MQRILNALLQFRNPILYYFLLGLAISFAYNRSPFHEYNIEKYGFFFSSKLYAARDGISQYFKLSIVNQQLLEENKRLKVNELISSEILLYPAALKKTKRFPFNVKKARVLKNSFQNQRNYLTIDIGSIDGVKPEMGVISNNGIIGVVHSVTDHYANVISVLHQDLKINVRATKSPAFGSLVWSGKKPYEFRVEDVVSNANIKIGDTLITGGMSSYFPLGIPIGKIAEINNKKVIDFFSDFSQLGFVKVVLYSKEKN